MAITNIPHVHTQSDCTSKCKHLRKNEYTITVPQHRLHRSNSLITQSSTTSNFSSAQAKCLLQHEALDTCNMQQAALAMGGHVQHTLMYMSFSQREEF